MHFTIRSIMRLFLVAALVLVVVIAVFLNVDGVLSYADYAANDMTRDVRNWVSSVLP